MKSFAYFKSSLLKKKLTVGTKVFTFNQSKLTSILKYIPTIPLSSFWELCPVRIGNYGE